MRFKLLNGRMAFRNIEKYRIDWDGKSLSKIQFLVKQFLKDYWKGQIVYEEAPLPGTKLQVDILNVTKKIAVEVNGKQHGEFNPFFHNNSRGKFGRGIRNDMIKREYLEANGYTVIEVKEGEEKTINKKWFEETFGVKL